MSRLSIGIRAVTALGAVAVLTLASVTPAAGGATARFAASGTTAQDEAESGAVTLVTVVGCLAEEPDSLPWILERATAGEQTGQAFTSEEELTRSAAEDLGSLRYRLLGVGEFGVEAHVGHRVQVKGLKLRYDGEWRLNVTSFQHLAPACE